jgi:hypothetical protein
MQLPVQQSFHFLSGALELSFSLSRGGQAKTNPTHPTPWDENDEFIRGFWFYLRLAFPPTDVFYALDKGEPMGE